MAPRFFGPNYVEHATLKDGTEILLRLVVPEDRVLLEAGFDRLSMASRYARFLGAKSALSEDELDYLPVVDQEDHFAMGAVAAGPDGAPIGLGVGRFIRLTDSPDTAEAAVAVADEMHGRGLGKLLFLRLCAAAAERGILRFRCEILGSNHSMKELLDRITPDRTVHSGGGLMIIELAIPGVEPTLPPATAVGLGPMYRLFQAAAENAVEWTFAVRKLWRRSPD